jgi:hypothetical protein
LCRECVGRGAKSLGAWSCRGFIVGARFWGGAWGAKLLGLDRGGTNLLELSVGVKVFCD